VQVTFPREELEFCFPNDKKNKVYLAKTRGKIALTGLKTAVLKQKLQVLDEFLDLCDKQKQVFFLFFVLFFVFKTGSKTIYYLRYRMAVSTGMQWISSVMINRTHKPTIELTSTVDRSS
jgi:hypothetical protein